MTRFIILSFAFLGWGFYELSGGTDFKAGSSTDTLTEAPDDVPAPEEELVARADTSAAPLIDLGGNNRLSVVDTGQPRLDVTLAVADPPAPPQSPPAAALEVDAEKLAALVAQGISEAETDADIALNVESDAAAEETAVLYSIDDLNTTGPTGRSDLRQVSGSRVNLRDGPGTAYPVVAQLQRGDEVAVLTDTGDGWLKLQVIDSNRIGWMADFLVTAQAD